MTDRSELIMDLIGEQAPALLVVDGVVYEGHLQSCVRGVVTAVVRAHGTHVAREALHWPLVEISDVGRADEPAEEPEDPLIGVARELAAAADGSLAEILLRTHTTRRERP